MVVFGQTLRQQFVDYDDNRYVYDNPMVAGGLTVRGFIWAFTHVNADEWYPLTTLSHMVDCERYGLRPGGHHLTNVLLHGAAAILLFLALRRMTQATWRSGFVAAVFAIHPLRAESVAWVTERKDVLSGVFFMLTLWAYVRYVESRRRKVEGGSQWPDAQGSGFEVQGSTFDVRGSTFKPSFWYGCTVILFALGLLSKTMLVTLPLVLWLLDYWPLRRAASAGRRLLEKLPSLGLSAMAGVATLYAQRGIMPSTDAYPLPLRLANALVACVVYLRQMFFPVGLAVFYPYPRHGLPPGETALAAMLLAGICVVVWRWRRSQPWLLVGWLWYLVMLLPVAGVIQVSRQAHADRYTYLSQIGLYVALTWLIAGWASRWSAGRAAKVGVACAGLIALMICAGRQTAYWKNSEALWRHALACTTDNDIAQASLGVVLLQKGEADQAIARFQAALEIRPGYAEAHNNLGSTLLQQGRVADAITHCEQALELRPNYADARVNLGNALCRAGRVAEGIAQYQRALELRPDFVEAYDNLGNALLQLGRTDEAIAQFENALRVKPGDAEAHYDLGNALLQKGRAGEAIAEYQRALQLNPGHAGAHLNVGNLLLQSGRVDEAIAQYRSALQSNPASATAHGNLGSALLQKGRAAEAMAEFQQALQLAPADPQAQNNLAWLLATCAEASLRDGSRALELAQQANSSTGGKSPIVLHTLAAAFAEAGRFGDATSAAKKALDLARAAGQASLAAELTNELTRYEAGLRLNQ